MREIEINSVRLRRPDPLFVFNPCIFAIDCEDGSFDVVAVRVVIRHAGETFEIYYDAYDSLALIDLRVYLQTFFDKKKFFEPLSQQLELIQTETYKQVSVTLEVSNVPFVEGEEIADLVTFNETCDVYWGALHNGEQFDPMKTRHIKHWDGYPFTCDIVVPSEETGENLLVSFYDDENDYDATADNAGIQRVPLDSRPLKTIMLGDRVILRAEQITCETDGIYLRWIDRYGRLSYWLFEEGNTQAKVSNSTDIYDNAADFTETYGIARRVSYQREDTISVCEPMADEETREMLMDITTSPLVDMYLPSTDSWLPVRAQAGTYTTTDKPLQDFTINIIKPEEDTQGL